MKSIIRAHFSGKATPLQRQMLLEWLKDPAHHDLFYQTLHEWEKENMQMLPDLESDWRRLQEGRRGPEPDGVVDRRSSPFRLWYYAAAVVLVFLGGWWQQERLLLKTYSTGYGQTQRLTLPDGSTVTLNADSRLTFPRFTWTQSQRVATLRGEAEFSVVHTKDHRPFVVKTQDALEVRVLGTEFIVYSRRNESKVVLSRGKVQLRSLKTASPPLNIDPGDVARINAKGAISLASHQQLEVHSAWKDHRLAFNRTALSDIALQIRERFGVEIEIADSALAVRRLSGNYPAENAEDVLGMITTLLDSHIEKRDKKIILVPNYQH